MASTQINDIVSTSLAGYDGAFNDRLYSYLKDKTAGSGSLNDLLFLFITQENITPKTLDGVYQYIIDNPVPSYDELVQLFSSGEEGLLVPSINDAIADGRLYQDAAGTTPATAVNDPVGKGEDYSGNGNDLTQTTATARPLLKQDGNGNWYLEGDGADNFLRNIAINIPQPFTIIIAAQFLSGSTQMLWSSADATGTNRADLLAVPDASPDYRIYAGGSVIAEDQLVAGERTVITGIYNGASSRLRKNGADIASGNVGAMSLDGITLMASYDDKLFFNGPVYGFLVREGVLTDAELSAAESYFASQSGVTP